MPPPSQNSKTLNLGVELTHLPDSFSEYYVNIKEVATTALTAHVGVALCTCKWHVCTSTYYAAEEYNGATQADYYHKAVWGWHTIFSYNLNDLPHFFIPAPDQQCPFHFRYPV